MAIDTPPNNGIFSDILAKMKELSEKLGGPYKYTALPENVTRDEVQRRAQVWADRHRRAVRLTLAAMALLAVAYFVFEFRCVRSSTAIFPAQNSVPSPSTENHVPAQRRAVTTIKGEGEEQVCDTPERGFQCDAEISHFWGQYSPYFAVAPAPGQLPAAVPAECTVTFAQVLSRHGARDPTAGKSQTYAALVDRIHDSVTQYGDGAAFLRDYKYTLGADELTAFGEQQLVNSGVDFFQRYGHLVEADGEVEAPFIRSAGQNRVVQSAQKWTEGFHRSWQEAKGNVTTTTTTTPKNGSSGGDDGYPYDILVIPEGTEYNNTLSDELCTAFEEGPDTGKAAQATWLDAFAPPITDRLNGAVLPGANLSREETIYMMDLCPYETVASPALAAGATRRLSPFCDLFTADEWRSYDYHETLGKWYGYGRGSGALGPTRGVGWANELIARLTSQPVADRTSTNATLDGDEATFPLRRRLYADFSHDNDMSSIYAALGLYNQTEPDGLPADSRRGPGKTGGFSASWSVPFAARMYVEKMQCGGGEEEEFVRVLVNDRVIPLQNCGADELGRCRLGKFVESLSFARGGGNWDMCFA
ncbi:hypothetical protein SLS62_007212 [Diatrype stigma]|uniref:3-phytase n=1 Tax=Diatrype stigma TaxID=117547 RepID=A0AAN9YMD1_9PEZI